MGLPENVSQLDFDAALGELRDALGQDYVFADAAAGLNAYNDQYNTLGLDAHAPSAAVAPNSVEEIQQVLAVARKYLIPLWTISTGRNFAYGGPAPRKAGYLTVDLKRMNRIIEVSEKHGYAVVEPGVSYFDLYNYLQEKGIKLWIDCAAPGWGGVLGNYADRGAGYTPYGEHCMTQCGMQVVLADGTVVETGMGNVPGAGTQSLYKYGHGAWVDGIFTQSNFGIVTRIGMWLMPEPPGYRPYMVTFPEEQDLHQVTELIRPLKINMVIPNAATTVGIIWDAAVKTTRAKYHDGKAPVPLSTLKKIAADQGLGMWNFFGALYGPEPLMANNWKIIKESLSQVKGSKFYFEEDRPNDATFKYRAGLMRGEPSMTEFSVLNWVGTGGHIDFAPMSATTGDDAMKQYVMVRDRLHEYGFDYVGEFLVGWRDMHHIIFLLFDRTDEAEKRRAFELFQVLIDDSAQAGYGEYRTHLDFMDQVAGTYNWNDGALAKVNEAIKDTLDPLGILAPGKQGIWPAGMRKG